jgi:hypothetical protein
MPNLTRKRKGNKMATKTYRIENISKTTTLITLEIQGKHNMDCAGWYIRNGEIISKRWDNQPAYTLSASKLKEAIRINGFLNYPNQGFYPIIAQ